MNILVAIVDGDRGTCRELAELIQTTPGLRLGPTCRSGQAAFSEIPPSGSQVILLEANLKDCPGYSCVARLRSANPGSHIVVLSRDPECRAAMAACVAGAHGFLPLNSSSERIVDAIAEVMSGGRPLAPQAARVLVDSCQVEKGQVVDLSELTRREIDVMKGIWRGYRTKEIASWLNLSVFTVQTHVRNIYTKLGARSAAHAVALYGVANRLASFE